MRYLDTGRRDPQAALGSWLADLSGSPEEVESIRCQSGFFGIDGIRQILPLLGSLSERKESIRILVGSNDGVTRRSDVESLLFHLGAPAENVVVGIVSYANAFFHPKVIHVVRKDGSMAGYVGSANLTASGVNALHIEAGVVLDTREGDDAAVLSDIADAVDWWFERPRDGLFLVASEAELDGLVEHGVLDVPRLPSPAERTGAAGSSPSQLPRLVPLIGVPKTTDASTQVDIGSGDLASSHAVDEPVPALKIVESWSKSLTVSDAQRKRSGNQRGSITLVKGRYPIDPQTYFRDVLFDADSWESEVTRTGEPREALVTPMLVIIDGINLGEVEMRVTHAENREAGQNNYVTALHLGRLSEYFQAEDMTGALLKVDRRSDGSIAIEIG